MNCYQFLLLLLVVMVLLFVLFFDFFLVLSSNLEFFFECFCLALGVFELLKEEVVGFLCTNVCMLLLFWKLAQMK